MTVSKNYLKLVIGQRNKEEITDADKDAIAIIRNLFQIILISTDFLQKIGNGYKKLQNLDLIP